MMKMGRVGTESAVPWWAAFGAPLIGVPLLVLLLALGSHADGGSVETGPAADELLPAQVEPVPQPPELPATLVELELGDDESVPYC